MAEGKSAGAVYLDLIIRDTMEKQTQRLAKKTEASVNRAVSAAEEKLSGAFSKVGAMGQKLGARIQGTFATAFSRTVGASRRELDALNRALEETGTALDEAFAKGQTPTNNPSVAAMEEQQARLREQLEQMTRRSDSSRSLGKAFSDAMERGRRTWSIGWAEIWERLVGGAKFAAGTVHHTFHSILSGLSGGAKTLIKRLASGPGKIAGAAMPAIKKIFGSAERHTSRFGTRLKGIVSGALIFNGISAGLRNLTNYLGTAIMQTDAMKTSMANLKGAAATAAAPIIQMLTPALSALANGAATVFAYLSRLISFFTGKSVSAMANAAKGMSKAGGAAGGAAKQMEKANRQLASFDELNQLQDQSGGDSGGGGDGAGELTPNFDFAPAENTFLEQFTEAIKQKDFSGAAKVLTGKLNSLVAGVDWYGVGAKAGSFLDGALLFLATAITTFDWMGLGGSFAQGINGVLNSVDWGNLGTVLSGKFYAILLTAAGFLLNLDWGALAEGFSRFAIGFFDGITNALTAVDWQELGGKVGIFLREIDWGPVATSAFTALGADFGAAVGFYWELLKKSLSDIGKMFQKHIDERVKQMQEMGEDLATGILLGILDGLGDIGKWIWDHIFKPFIDGFCEAFGIHSPSKVMEEQGVFLIEGLFNGIVDTWAKVTGFLDSALSKIENAFSRCWTAVRNSAVAIWDGIVAAIKSAVNGIIGAVNGMIRGVVNGINLIGQALNALSFRIPEWVPGFGGYTFGLNVPQISAPQIPYLAGGAVIPPNDEFMAVLGDQKHGTNIEAPLETIKQAVAEVMAELNMTDELERNNALLAEIIEILRQILAKCGFSIDGRSFAKYMRSQLRDLERAGGA